VFVFVIKIRHFLKKLYFRAGRYRVRGRRLRKGTRLLPLAVLKTYLEGRNRMRAIRTGKSMSKREKKIFVIISTVFILLSTITSPGNRSTASSASDGQDFGKLRLTALKPPAKAPMFALKNLQGKMISLEAFQGKPLMLYFWATW